ncbi:DUF4431 domain-containing protein [Flavobacterium columnare]|uniref:DUF4431 domain-containing protein n=1 Tax=Flavobacterium columnare TaxID=996 RepID=A0AA94JMF1_9FLAO|nr:DUF4431 domain-containing protein [Flavobacterium columnare]MCH4828637.1 DUF4431 domain-containing protein [Flavobacterium columnare]MCH4831890.1 DUF4431 domain-containing protein [Flavobacterium columnare]
MTKKQFYLLFTSALTLILIFTNPSEENHIQSVKSKLKTAFKKKMTTEMIEDNSNSMQSLGKGIGLLLGDTFIDKMTDGFISRNNYLLFSTTKAEYKGESKVIGFGVLGNVFLSDKVNDIFNKEGKKYKGKVVTELQYGPPGYGEDKVNDKKVYPYFLILDNPINLTVEDGISASVNNVEKIQLTSTQNINLENYKDSDVEISGELFEAHTGHHYTDILIDVKNIE